MNRRTLLAAAFMTLAAFAAHGQDARLISIGTGGVTGVYYPAGAAICREVNKDRRVHALRCLVEATGGSVANIERLVDRTLDFAIVQADVQYTAFNGVREFADKGAVDDLRSVFTLHPEPFTLVVHPDAGISDFDDLRGKRVNIGNPGSGQRNTMARLMDARGWTNADFALASELASSAQAEALCSREIDAFVFTVGHPSGSITEAARSCGAIILDVTGDAVDRLVAENAYYERELIPGGIYDANRSDIRTFGGWATLVTRADVPDDVVHALTTAVFDDLEGFKKLHPAFERLDAQTMVTDGRTAPLHPGAERYFAEHELF